jgi:hypothetical protein
MVALKWHVSFRHGAYIRIAICNAFSSGQHIHGRDIAGAWTTHSIENNIYFLTSNFSRKL